MCSITRRTVLKYSVRKSVIPLLHVMMLVRTVSTQRNYVPSSLLLPPSALLSHSENTQEVQVEMRRACKVFAGIGKPLCKHLDSNISYFTNLMQTHLRLLITYTMRKSSLGICLAFISSCPECRSCSVPVQHSELWLHYLAQQWAAQARQ